MAVAAQPARAGTVEITPDLDCAIDNASFTGDCDSTDLHVGIEGTDAVFQHVGLFQFDLAGNLPPGAEVESAELRLYVRNSGTGSTYPEAFEAHQVTEAWTSGVTWDTTDGVNAWSASFELDYPSYSALDSTDIAHWLSGVTVSWDVTAAAQSWATSAAPNHGLAVRGPLGELSTREAFFASSEDEDDGVWPVLEVDYSL